MLFKSLINIKINNVLIFFKIIKMESQASIILKYWNTQKNIENFKITCSEIISESKVNEIDIKLMMYDNCIQKSTNLHEKLQS